MKPEPIPLEPQPAEGVEVELMGHTHTLQGVPYMYRACEVGQGYDTIFYTDPDPDNRSHVEQIDGVWCWVRREHERMKVGTHDE